MYAVEIELDVKERFVEVPDQERLKGKHVRVLFITEDAEQRTSNKNSTIDFSPFKVEAFKDIDSVAYQRAIRDEWD